VRVAVGGAELVAAARGGAEQQGVGAGGAPVQGRQGARQEARRVRQAAARPAGERRAEGGPGNLDPDTILVKTTPVLLVYL
jgi:hypothetical protein